MTATPPELRRATQSIDRLRGWLVESALPLWIDRGFDVQAGGFHERLDFDANPITDIPRRLTVQARQIFVYSRAVEMGWGTQKERVGTAYDSMISRYYRADGKPAFIFSVDATGGIIDSSRDLYALAFFVLATSAYYRLTGDSQVIGLVDDTLAYIDDAMATPNGGYFDRAPNPPARLTQNPHMHLFEALLAIYEATGNDAYLARAGKICDAFNTKFFQPGPGILAEYFDGDWKATNGDNATWEPGHHMEWAWLLAEYEKLSGVPTAAVADRLIDVAYRHGVSPEGRIVDEVSGDGTVLKRSCRSWPLTEAAKAQAVRLRSGGPLAAERLTAAVDGLYDRYLSGVVPGLWNDHLAEDGTVIPDYVPASTLYHIATSAFVTHDAIVKLTI